MSYQPYDRNPSGIVFFGTSASDQVFESNDVFIYDSGTSTLEVPNISTTTDVDIGRHLTVAGNLTVNGTTTTVNSTVVTIEDPIIILGSGSPTVDDNKDRGISFNYYDGGAKTGFFGWNDDIGQMTFIPDATITNEVVSGSIGTIAANLAGNASTASVATDASGLTSAVTVALINQLSGSQTFQDGGDTCTINASLTAASITGQIATTGAQDADLLLIYDNSASALRKITRGNFISDLGIMDTFTVSGDAGTVQTISDGNNLYIAGGDGVTTTASNTDTLSIAVDSTVIRTTGASPQTIETSLVVGGDTPDLYISGAFPALKLEDTSGLGSAIAFDGSNGQVLISYNDGNEDEIQIINPGGDVRLEPAANKFVVLGADGVDSSGVQLKAKAAPSSASYFPVFVTNPASGPEIVYSRTAAQVKSDLALNNVDNVSLVNMAGSGLSSSDLKLHVGAGTGIIVDANTVNINPAIAGTGLDYDNGILNVTNIPNSALDNDSVTYTAGSGLSGGGTVALGATGVFNINTDNSTIEVNADILRVVPLGIDTAQLAADAVDGTKIADDAVNSEHIASGAIDLEHMSANSVDSDQYVDGSIDNVHLASGIDINKLTANTVSYGGVTLALGGTDSTPAFNLVDASGYKSRNVVTSILETSVSVTASGDADVYLCNGGSGGLTVTLPAIASNAGRRLTIKKIDSGVGQIVIDGNGSETIDGALTKRLYYENESLTIVCHVGATPGWYII